VSSPIEAARQAATAAGVKVTDLKVGKGQPALAGATVRVDYTGWLQDTSKPDGKGAKFDSSVDRPDPFVFPLGQRQVIQGWDLGVAGMQAGGKRLLVIPSEMGYGPKGTPGGPIPPNATLVFEVSLIDFLPAMKRAAPGPK
jgi:FKBP-type peptidyl-prolyl cis-trans isomerase FkpA